MKSSVPQVDESAIVLRRLFQRKALLLGGVANVAQQALEFQVGGKSEETAILGVRLWNAQSTLRPLTTVNSVNCG